MTNQFLQGEVLLFVFKVIFVVVSGRREFFNKHIYLQDLAHLHPFGQYLSTQVLIGMDLFHDWLIIHDLDLQPLVEDVFSLSNII